MNSKFFENKSCEYYPCHKGLDNINCLFCFCPLYHSKCKGNFTITDGAKDCSNCTFPHKSENYDNIIEKLKKFRQVKNGIYNKYGIIKYYKNGKLHREDGPAVISKNGIYEWWLNGKLHREDGPAIEEHHIVKTYDGPQKYTVHDTLTKKWYKNGKLHREDGPANITPCVESWYKNGRCHREDGPAIIENNRNNDGTSYKRIWAINGLCHREDGPGKILDCFDNDGNLVNSTYTWYKKGQIHRVDGPAIEYYDCLHKNMVYEWYIKGVKTTYDEVCKKYIKKYPVLMTYGKL